MESSQSSGAHRRDRISRGLQQISDTPDPEARAEFAIEVLDNVLLGLQGPYFDLCPEDVRLLRSTLEEAGRSLLDSKLHDTLSDLERSTALAFPATLDSLPVVQLKGIHAQWLDQLSEVELLDLARPPNSVQELISQTFYTAPPSADFELFQPERVIEFGERVQERCKVPDFRVGIIRADLHFPSGAMWRQHPLHALSTFTYGGELQVGSLFGSSSGLFLRHYKHVPFDYLQAAVIGLVLPVLHVLKPESATIGIPAPVRFDPTSGTWCPEDRPPSTEGLTYRTLCARPLSFELVTPRVFDQATSVVAHNHYFYRGPPELWNDPEFASIVTSIREVRREMRVEAREGGGFVPLEIARDRIRKDWAREFLAHYFGYRG